MMRVLLATPSLDGIPCIEYQTALMKTNALLIANGIQLDVNFIRGDQFISKARNALIQGFIDSAEKQDLIFFIDDDEGWDEQAFLRMCLDPHEFVAAAVPKKCDTLEFNNVILEVVPETNECIIENGLLKAKQIGSGFIRLKRSAIEKLIKAYPRQYAPGDGGPHQKHYALFDSKIIWPKDGEVGTGQFWGEDLEFCRKWCSLGEFIWIDPNVMMEHAGRKVYRGNFLEHLKQTCNVQMNEPKKLESIPETLAAIEKIAA
jgi:glycosyltransferase involved in cell wall biosynthesis